MTRWVNSLVEKLWVSRPLVSRQKFSDENIRAMLINKINRLYHADSGFRAVLEVLSSAFRTVERIILAPPTSSAGAYLAIWGATGISPIESILIVAYDYGYEEYTLNIIIHEMAHKWAKLCRANIPDLYNEALAYFLAFEAGFKKFYREEIKNIVEIFSRFRPPNIVAGKMEYEVKKIILPRIIADVLSDNIDPSSLGEFLNDFCREKIRLGEKLKVFAKENYARAIGCLVDTMRINLDDLQWAVEQAKTIKEVSTERFFEELAYKTVLSRYFDEQQYLYRNLVTLLSLSTASRIFGSEKAKQIFSEFLNEAKIYSEEVCEYLLGFLENPDIYIPTLREAAEIGFLPKDFIDGAIKEAEKFLDYIINLSHEETPDKQEQ